MGAALLLLAALLASLLVPISFVNAWPGRIMLFLWLGLMWYALLLFWRARKRTLHGNLCIAGMVLLALVTLEAFFVLLSDRRAVEYITSPSGENTAVVIRESFTATGYSVHPLHCKFFIRGDEGIQLGLGADPPDTAQFVWVDENTLQFADENGKTLTIRF